jgi:glycine/D-amino acid oxidase-like deaminating enzyme
MSETYDVVFVGGGLMSCATAYYLLKNDPALKIVILEKDASYEKNSTVLSDGNTRLQFNLKENIQISQYALDVLETFEKDMAVQDSPVDIGFRQEGNLFLTDESGKENIQAGLALQQSLGCETEWLNPDEISKRFPLIDGNSVSGGVWGPLDGTMDPYAVLVAFKNKSIEMGAEFREAEVTEILREGSQVTGVRLTSGEELKGKFVVNGAGGWATGLAKTVGVELPVSPVMRSVFIVEADVQPDFVYPLVVFPAGLYLHHEHGGKFMFGKSMSDDPVGFDFVTHREKFMDILWPELVEFAPAFERLKIVGSWAGLYAVNTFDGNVILGEWPELKGFMLINGFSGHGFQQCHAVGRYLAEEILGTEHALDLSIFTANRILENRPVFEGKGKLV